MEFTIYNLETVPEESKQALAHAQETFGFIPNLEGILAEAPALLKGSVTLWDLFETTSFTEVERQVIYLTANYENSCDYCMAAHSGLAKMIGMSQENVQALRNGTLMPDKKLQALWQSSDAFHGSVVMAMALWGTVFGAIFGGIPTNKLGSLST